MYHDAIRAYEELVPPPERREPLTLASVPVALLGPLLPLLFLAYLARRADTHLVRLLVLPVAIAGALYSTYHYKLEDHRLRIVEVVRSEPESPLRGIRTDAMACHSHTWLLHHREVPEFCLLAGW